MNILNNTTNLSNSNHVFYRALVEDNNDPKKLNRVKVRILGIHSKDETKVPVNSLPWAEIAAPTMVGGQQGGIGWSSVPVKGTWVWIFFDAGNFNRPIISGSMYGIPNEASSSKGFEDPDGVYPKSDRLGEPDTNRLARNEKIISDTLIGKIKDPNRDFGIATATGKVWDEEKEKNTSAEYPHNHVMETITENYIEYDDTPGNSRIHFFHNSGTYWEIKNDGKYDFKTVHEKKEINDKDTKRLSKMSEYITIWKNQELKIDGHQEIRVGKYRNEIVHGDVNETYNSNRTEKVAKHVSETYGSHQENGGAFIDLDADVIYLN